MLLNQAKQKKLRMTIAKIMKVSMSTTKLDVYKKICEQYTKELKCFVAKAIYQQKR